MLKSMLSQLRVEYARLYWSHMSTLLVYFPNKSIMCPILDYLIARSTDMEPFYDSSVYKI